MLHSPYTLSDSQFGLAVVVVFPILGGLYWLYNAYRMGKLKWKPTGPANPRMVCFVIFLLILLFGLLMAAVG